MSIRDQSYGELWIEKMFPSGEDTLTLTQTLGVEPDSGLAKVVGLVVESTFRSVVATWATVSGATVFYEVEIATLSDMSNAQSFLEGGTRFEFPEADLATTYYIRVRARLGTLQGPFSEVASATVGQAVTADFPTDTVTVPSFLFSNTVFTGVTSEITINTLVINSNGRPLIISAFCAFTSEGQAFAEFRILRDGVQLYKTTPSVDTGNASSYISQTSNSENLFDAVIADQPAAGTHTYTLLLKKGINGSSVGSNYSGIYVLEART